MTHFPMCAHFLQRSRPKGPNIYFNFHKLGVNTEFKVEKNFFETHTAMFSVGLLLAAPGAC